MITSLRNELIMIIKEMYPSIEMKDTKYYFGFKRKYNFVEVHKGKKRLKIVVASKALNKDQRNSCRVVPEDFGWVLDAEYTIQNKNELEYAIELIRASYNYKE